MREDHQYLYGLHVVRDVLETHPERLLEIYCLEDRHDNKLSEILALAKKQGISVQRVQKQKLDQWTGKSVHQGIVAKVRNQVRFDDDDLIQWINEDNSFPKRITKPEISPWPPCILILDGIQDPHNLGACLRTADAAGVMAVVIPKDRSAALTPLVQKIASGAANTVPVVEVINIARTIERLKQAGIWIMGTAGEASQTLFDLDLRGPIAIVLGAEGSGLRHLTREVCDHLMRIPMLGTVESLNVSVACGICLYEVLRQRT